MNSSESGRNHSWLAVVLMAWTAGASAAPAAKTEKPVQRLMVTTSEGELTCDVDKQNRADAPADATSVSVEVVKAGPDKNTQVVGLLLARGTDDTQPQKAPSPTESGDKASLIYSLQRSDLVGKEFFPVLVAQKAGEASPQQVSCGALSAFASESPKKDQAEGTPKSSDAAKDALLPSDVPAQFWWRQFGEKERAAWTTAGTALGLPDDTLLLVHLPSGNPAFSSPISVREGTPIQMAVILPTTDTRVVTLTRKGCAPRDTFRVKTSEKELKQARFVPQGDFVLLPMGPHFACGAGELSYDLTFSAGGVDATTSSEVRMRPVHHLAATVLLGYDFAFRRSYGIDTTTDEAGASVRTVSQQGDREGPITYLGALWTMGGVDYEEMRWYNYFANLFLAVDPTSPTEDFALGLAITPTGGLSLALGASIHRGTVLDGVAVGQVIPGEGAVPTRGSWSEFEPGAFIGLTIDTNIADSIKSAFSTPAK